jgi:immune inhibitor A
MSAWCLSALGWIKPKNITAAGNLTLKALEGDKTACYRLWTKGKASKEYFLIENRQQKGCDAKLPGHGLAVWHIDETQSDNTNPLAYKVALVQADGKRDIEFNKNSGDPGDMFPGSAGVTKVDDKGVAHPHTRKNDGTTSGVALSKIKEVNGVVQVSVKV